MCLEEAKNSGSFEKVQKKEAAFCGHILILPTAGAKFSLMVMA